MDESWRKLRVGDRVRFVSMPSEFAQPSYFVHRDTLQLYKRLIHRRRSVRVAFLGDWGEGKCPWIRCRFRRKDGRIEHHALMINHGGWVKVKPRKRR